MIYRGTKGDDHFRGTDEDDTFYVGGGGADKIEGLGGNDRVYTDVLVPGSRFDGGSGFDTLFFGKGLDNFALTGDNFTNFEALQFYRHARGTIANACDPAGHHLTVELMGHGYDIDASAVNGDLTVIVYNVAKNNRAHFMSGSGNDVLEGGFERNHLDGGPGNDTIYDGLYNDRLKGGAGDDSIHASYSDNKLSGGTGADQFIFAVGFDSRIKSSNVVTDFDVREDKVSIFSRDLRSYSQLIFEDDGRGGTTVIFYLDQTVDLRHVARDTITASNFIFEPEGVPLHSDSFMLHAAFGPSSLAYSDALIGGHSGAGDLHIASHATLV